MSMPIHVVTVVGGAAAAIVPHTIRHYRSIGVDSFFVSVHVPERDEAFVANVSQLARSCGVALESVEIDPYFPRCKDRVFSRVMRSRPDDWFLPIDCDELQRYPVPLDSVLEGCEERGYDYVRGCFVDRVSADGSLAPLRPELPIWTQYPLGGFLTYPVLGGDPRKVVLAKGRVSFRSCGHHDTLTGVPCPSRELFVPVHHFKWVGTLVPYLQDRRQSFKGSNNPYWRESDRALAYFARHGRIEINDPRLLMARCDPEYPFWDRLCHMLFDAEAGGNTVEAVWNAEQRSALAGEPRR